MQPTYLTHPNSSKRLPTPLLLMTNHHHNNNNNNDPIIAPPPIRTPSSLIETSTTTTPPPPPKGNNAGGGNQACAACKYQRRKCAPDCILAPYFPHDRTRQFLNAHRLFGVSNITKIIKNLNPPDKDEAMRTIIFQSDVRASDPVGGCYQIIRDLQRQIEFLTMELELVLHQLAICHGAEAAAAAAAVTNTTTTTLGSSTHHHDSSSPSINLLDPPFQDTYNHLGFHPHHQQQHHLQAHIDDAPAEQQQQQHPQHDQESVLSNDHNVDNNHHQDLTTAISNFHQHGSKPILEDRD
ncbi:protein LATERAL ORGAN BOUNDARIES [Impatiens glandulifera]|uniref:protein LATERAL ORGAN BOUNDARIES n=1 Tax=Impatiens glandulifera TaxID=253017 RepID=UPI001FB10F6C|nr:protein LATERAL ORGAN BOUNDARIES [Impatiens glandulifera]